MTSERAATIPEIVERAIALNPVQAVRTRRERDACLLWVDEILDEAGNLVRLRPCPNGLSGKEGYVFIYGRVSTPVQVERERGGEGWSMRTQFERGVYYAVSNGWRFCLFSDAELSGGMPTNDPAVIQTLYTTKANVYRSVMRAIWLPEHYKPRPDEERRSVERYIDEKCRLILSGRARVAEEMDESEAEKRLERQLATINTRGQEVVQRIYRPGLDAAIRYLRDAAMLVVTDSSRVARSQYLMQHILPRLREHGVRTKGLIEEWDWPNQDGIGSALQGGVLSALHEDAIRSATAGALRGMQTRLERGEPVGLLPFWYVKTPRGESCPHCGAARWPRLKSEHHLCPARVEHVRRIVRLYLDADGDTTRGLQLVARLLEDEGIAPKRSKIWHWTSVRKILANPALIGKEQEFGLLWDVLDPVIPEEDWLRVCHKIKERSDRAKFAPLAVPRRHLLTGLLQCVCGLGMSYSSRGIPDCYNCNIRSFGRAGGVPHTRIPARSVEGFVDRIFEEYGPFVISHLNDEEAQRYALKIEAAQAELFALAGEIPVLEEGARRRAEADLDSVAAFQQQKGSEGYRKMLAGAVEATMEEHLRRRQALQEHVRQLRHDQALYVPRQFRAQAEEKIRCWRETSTEDKNSFLRTYFSSFTFEGARGGERLVPVLRDGVARWPAIRLRLGGTKFVWRRMPPVEEYVSAAYEDVLAGEDVAGDA